MNLSLHLRRHPSRESRRTDEAFPMMDLWAEGISVRLWEPYRVSHGSFSDLFSPRTSPGKVRLLEIQMSGISGLMWALVPLPLDFWIFVFGHNLSPTQGSGAGIPYCLDTSSQLQNHLTLRHACLWRCSKCFLLRDCGEALINFLASWGPWLSNLTNGL